ncbi:hypothetical protein BS47DRAFT_371105 [Hydnum rufescens UP504]|uniref:Uncharacterized protein n=1 Tax=Hydnum rufescens UP504 TaxID=1448309 RepID=A0A9P6B895_9AGAM|nr:hypothetical protein BS47DRAFT_371105 [Hydnum rufescens UP504]
MRGRDSPLRVRKSLNGPLVLPPRDHPSSQSSERLTLGLLPAFLRDYNRQPEQKASVRLLRESRAAGPPVLRVAIPGILVAYMKLAPVHVDNAALRVMSITFMGSSESRPPNGSSEYAVFQQATQHFARLLADRDDLPIGLLLDLLSTYDVLFSHGCVLCGTLLSRTRRLPPVGRLWNEDPEEGEVPWQPCHIECIR